MKTQKDPYISIYALHHFEGEYPIGELCQRAQTPGKYDFWGFIELDSSTIEELIDAKILTHDSVAQFIKNKYNLDTEPCETYQVIGIQFRNGTPKKSIAEALYKVAQELIAHEGTDDDFYDYTPNTVEALGQLCKGLGFPKLSEKLNAELEANGHFD